MELVRFLLARSRRTLVLAVMFGFVSGALNSGLLALVNTAIFRHAGASSTLFLAFLALCLSAPLARVICEVLLIRLGQNAIFSLRTELGRQVVAVPLNRLEQVGPHRVLSVLTDDIPNITNMASTIPLLCINCGVIVSCLLYMGWLQANLLLAVLGVMAAGIVTYQLAVGRAVRHFIRARQLDNDLQSHFQGLIHGIKELKLHRRRREAFLENVLGGTALAARNKNRAALTVYALAGSWGQFLVFGIIGIPIFFFAHAFGAREDVMTGFSLALLYLMTPLQVVMNSAPGLARANVAINNVRQLGLKLTGSAAPGENAPADGTRAESVRLDLLGVTYSYRRDDSPDEFTLGPIDLTIEPGELLFLTGGNGSGKTTLAKLIVGLYAPDTGHVLHNGQAVTDRNRDSYRQSFSAVFSDFFLFESLLGLEGARLDDRVRESLRSLRLDHKVRIQDGVLSTTQLSQGQRKRLALLTSCLEERPILFFDEWAAEQDPVFKEIFYLSILPELKARGRTVIVISHDDRYFAVADRIVHLESGCIASGAPAFLTPAASI